MVCWPTSLGWIVGPLILYSALLNGATLALYNGSPLGRGFGKFVQVINQLSLKVNKLPFIIQSIPSSMAVTGVNRT